MIDNEEYDNLDKEVIELKERLKERKYKKLFEQKFNDKYFEKVLNRDLYKNKQLIGNDA